ncbi:unnamed protein product [Durusdinium trenchii]|uniref:Tubulin-specific chaperone A n=1 Tax=Durusdinium trenchii TaxID=1381693 RepID=A0ABP0H8H1_9DINO|eukprot:g13884.t1
MVQRLETIASSRASSSAIGIPSVALRSVAELEQLCMRREAFIVQLERELALLRQPSRLQERVEALEEIVRLGIRLDEDEVGNVAVKEELHELVKGLRGRTPE